MKRIVAALVVSLLAVAPVAGDAQEESGGAEQAPTADDEATYRAALATLSAAPGASHTLTLTGPIVLAGAQNPEYSGTVPLTIEGAGFTLDGSGNSQVIDVTNVAAPQLTVQNIVVSNGFHGSRGGAVASTGDVVIDNATLSNNQVDGAGPLTGGAVAGRVVTVTGSNLLTNSLNIPSGVGTVSGGAIHASVSASIAGSTVTGNTAVTTGVAAEGGAVHADGAVEINNTQMTGNRAEKGTANGGNARGGAVSGGGLVTVVNSSTLTGNEARASANEAEGGAARGGGGVTISDSTVSDNDAVTAVSGNAASGGAVRAVGPVAITDSTLATNDATSTANVAGTSSGGAVRASGGAVQVLRSTVHGNRAQGTVVGSGGAFYTSNSAPLTVTDSLVTDNEATAANGSSQGGASIVFSAATTIDGSDLRGNMATATPGQGRGGALNSGSAGASVSITDSALAANTATTLGGAVYGTLGPLSVMNSTVAGNSAFSGGGLHNSNGTITLSHATVAANTGSANDANLQANAGLVADRSVVADPLGTNNCSVVGGTTTNGHNVESGVDCGFTNTATGDSQNATTESVALGPLGDNGGPDVGDGAETVLAAAPTPTRLPDAGSILVDAIPVGDCAPGVPADQRGRARPSDGDEDNNNGCDVGAVERQALCKATDPHPFTDVPAGLYYTDAVAWLLEQGITTGTSPTTYSPNWNVTRAQMAAFLWRAADSPPPAGPSGFTDVPAGLYYTDAVAWLLEQGITTGTSPTTYSPNWNVTRAQMAAFLWRAADSPPPAGPSGFTDVPAGLYYTDAVAWLLEQGITTGTSPTTYSPNWNVTRAQMAAFLWRQCRTLSQA